MTDQMDDVKDFALLEINQRNKDHEIVNTLPRQDTAVNVGNTSSAINTTVRMEREILEKEV